LSLLARRSNARLGKHGEVWIELDAEPMPLQLFGGYSGGAAAKEGIEDQTGLRRRLAVATRCESRSHGSPAEGANDSSAPGQAAAGAARLWTASLNGSDCQVDWKDSMMPGNGACRDLPDVARILAQRVADAAFGLQDVKPNDRVAVGPSPCFSALFLAFPWPRRS
jgi:hypothetical protein